MIIDPLEKIPDARIDRKRLAVDIEYFALICRIQTDHRHRIPHPGTVIHAEKKNRTADGVSAGCFPHDAVHQHRVCGFRNNREATVRDDRRYRNSKLYIPRVQRTNPESARILTSGI